PAPAENLDAEAARRFVVGKLLAFTCVDGSRGVARVYETVLLLGPSNSTARNWLARCGCRWRRLSSQARQSALHSIAPSCALLSAKRMIKVSGPRLRG